MEHWQFSMLIMVLYLVIALVVGVLAGRGTNKASLEEFTTAGRGLGLFLTWFLMGGAIFSAFSFLGAPGWAFTRGAPAFYILAYLAFSLLPWYILGPKIGRIGRKFNLYSLVGFIQTRFQSKALGILVGFIAFFACIQYLATQLRGMAIIFNIMTEGRIAFWFGALVAYAIVVTYVATGGLRAAAWSDVFQGALMITVSWVVGIMIVKKMHGTTGEMFSKIAAADPDFLRIGTDGSTMSAAAFTSVILVSVIGFLMWPHMFARSYSSNAPTIKKTVIAYPLFALLIIPLLLAGFAAVGVVDVNAVGESDQILPYLITTFLSLPGWLYGLVGAAALAAAMSSADVITHSASMEFTDGVIKNMLPNLTEKVTLMIMRSAVVVIGAMAYLIAVFGGQGVVALLLGAYGSIIQFTPGVLSALYWKRVTSKGVFMGIVVGFAVNFYYQLVATTTPFEIHPGLIGLIANTVVMIGVSYMTKPEDSTIIESYVEDRKKVSKKEKKDIAPDIPADTY
ncbi:sodium:solute symporter family protein [Sporosarcina newyorkensis]|uniref:Solute:Na+ symporter, SSS family n=2 Tax=Sporosarcina newyorkensis TaxID=759851 RepID=A0A1T4Y1L7_9BACL|nr:sodium:solute symporter family protein [Sporosarcina newyorkensis]EGQ26897.1 Na+/solute symporter [Sporosarcina newyorkensis 2681]SKA95175.1 solute:Na+ symporter, SSS family [Sporosarcina newyorkensis]